LFNACDRTATAFACGSWLLEPGKKLGKGILRAEHDHTLLIEWSGTSVNDSCRLSLDGKRVADMKWKHTSIHGLSYVHLIAAGEQPGSSVLIEKVSARAN
jgi:hypothetical protein